MAIFGDLATYPIFKKKNGLVYSDASNEMLRQSRCIERVTKYV